MIRKSLTGLVLTAFLFFCLNPVYAGSLFLNLPAPGTPVHISPAFKPVMLQGIRVDPKNPLHLDFIIDTGDTLPNAQTLRAETLKLVRYFLASLTVPNDQLWVNLSPYEKNRIIPDGLALTEMGNELLAQDYMLKQLTASLMGPEQAAGKQFWSQIYAKAGEKYGSSPVPLDIFNKVWIVPDKATVYEHQGTAVIVDSHLKVMLEQDYLALKKNHQASQNSGSLASALIREVVLPQIEREVNEGRNFAGVRQVNNALILAAWFKQNLKRSFLGQRYANRNKVSGIDLQDRTVKQKIYAQYLKAFKKGVYNYIKEDVDPRTQQTVARKYFLGGYNGADLKLGVREGSVSEISAAIGDHDLLASIDLAMLTDKAAGAVNTADDNREYQKLNPLEENVKVSSDGLTYGGAVARAKWYAENLGFDIDLLVDKIVASGKTRAAEFEIVDVSAGTGMASETLLDKLRARGIRIKKLSLVDIDTNLSRDYMNYAIGQLRDKYKDVAGEIDFYILRKLKDGSFAPVSAIDGLRGSADYVLMENAIHVVPFQYRQITLEGIKEIMKPGAELVMGSGSIISGPQENGTVFIDSLFTIVRQRVLKIINGSDNPDYQELKGIIANADKVKIEKLLQTVFPDKPTRDDVLGIGAAIGLPMRFDTHFTKLEKNDYKIFITGIEGYVNSAILPELGDYLRNLQKRSKELKADSQEFEDLNKKISDLKIQRDQLVDLAYEQVFADQGEKGFQVPWARFIGIKAKSSDAAQISKPRPEAVDPSLPFGGINLDPDLGFVRVERDANGAQLPVATWALKNINIEGIQPVLLKIISLSGRHLQFPVNQ
jgi:hypothetical protein